MFIGERANERLQERRRELVREGDETDVTVVEPQRGFQDRIDRRDQRLEGVVDEVGEAKREQNRKHGRDRGYCGFDVVVDASRRAIRGRFTRWAHADTLNALRPRVAAISVRSICKIARANGGGSGDSITRSPNSNAAK